MISYSCRSAFVFLLSLIVFTSAFAKPATVTPNDIYDERVGAYAFTNATIQINPDKKLSNATLLIRDGKIVKVGTNVKVPADTASYDMTGRYIYAGLIELDSAYGLPDAPARSEYSWTSAEVTQSKTPGAYNANEAIKSSFNAADHFTYDKDAAEKYRALGFGAVLTHQHDGLARGTGALVSLGNEYDQELIIKAAASAHYSLDKGSSEQTYPRSPMGFIAVLRQTYYDASWYSKQKNPAFTDLSLEAWTANQKLPQIFDASKDWLSVLRADTVGDEFKTQYVIRSAGDEYQRIDSIAATGASLIVPINFPQAMDVSDPLQTDEIALAEMLHWELAPTNPGALSTRGIPFAITSAAESPEKTFWKNLRKAIKHGLSEKQALAALTTEPARILGVEKQLGQLRAGAIANFMITSAGLFDDNMVIEENWINGRRYKLAEHQPDLSGQYQLTVNQQSYPLEIRSAGGKHSASLALYAKDDSDNKNPKVNFSYSLEQILISFAVNEDNLPIRLSGIPDNNVWSGKGQLADGQWTTWNARRTGDVAQEADTASNDTDLALGSVMYPFTAYGIKGTPAQQNLLLKNATVWTNEEEGILENADVWIKNGKIAAVGKNLTAAGANRYDASGMHVTSGIIDEHSHIALSSVNDVATNSSMVRMNDVINSEDINIYRNLSGGVTAGQLLHGSANPIGGQSALIKYRWGATPDQMKIKGADGFIKFALGENVKRSSNSNSVRYPQTRMGVEQVFRDSFSRAQAYQKAGKNKRRDLAMDTISEIINGERFITSHSYVQSEINMLMKVAEDYDFNINTFTHILEGYKVADKMAAHGVGGSTFSDWWAYKWEVRYAIPYNAALMTQAGVTVAINSDSREMSRRLNQEAAKSVKYGGMSEQDVWKMVTLNPAKLLHLDDRMGSIKKGKDADIVVWNQNPLSIYAIADMTLVDGRIYYSRTKDSQARTQVQNERTRLINKLHQANAKGEKTSHKPSAQPDWHCDSMHGYEHLTGALQ